MQDGSCLVSFTFSDLGHMVNAANSLKDLNFLLIKTRPSD
jgi:hypothetical protein